MAGIGHSRAQCVRSTSNDSDVLATHSEHLVDAIGHLSDEGTAAYARFLWAETDRICGPTR